MDEVLRELELTHRKDAAVSTLSGGEQKRVNVGVELLTRPSLLFLDEPTSGLDPGLERKFILLIKRLTGMKRRSSGVATLGALVLAVPLGALGLAIALASWQAKAGAVMEVWAVREGS